MPTSSTIDKDDAYERRRRIEAKEIEEELIKMSNFGMAVELNGEKRGIAIGRKQEREQLSLEHIRNVMESTKWSAQQVMEAMGIPKNEQAHYASILDTDNEETLDAFKEVEDMKKRSDKYKGFSSVNELMSDLNDKNTKE